MIALAEFAPLAATSLAAAIWQSAVLVLCVAIVLRLLPGVTATARSLIWSGVFLVTVGLPFGRFVLAGSAEPSASSSLHVDPRWALAVAAMWAVLSVVRGGRLLRSAVSLRRIARQSTPVAAYPEIAAVLARANVSLCTSTEVHVPSVAGFLHRRILLPAALAGRIAHADLHQIVLHELEHLRRRDDWTNLLQKLALVLFPLNPVLMWVERRLCLERELACDDGVLRETRGATKAYATCLANLAEASLLRRGLSLALGAWQRQSEIARRVHRILCNPAREMSPSGTAALAMLTLAAMLGTGVLAMRSPELITFTASPGASQVAAVSAIAYARPVRATLVNAVMPQPRPALATLRVSHRHVRRSRTQTAGAYGYSLGPNIVLIGWQAEQFRGPRWAAPASFQPTYAAVPTRTGWLVFQL